MARRSAFEHLKPEIEAEFQEGKHPTDLYGAYSQVPRATIREWFKPYRQDSTTNSTDIPPDNQNLAVTPTQVLPPPSKLVAIDGGDNASDFQLARRVLRSIARNPSQEGASVGVQAAVGLMKLIQLRAEMPKHILEESEDVTIEDERNNIKDVPPSEVARRYKEALG
ncbi:MAG TPA: hypothetical protein V6C57_28445 [Coleofasciculaceae cyanobacterium]